MAPSTAPQAQPKKQSLSSPLPGQGTSPLHNWRPLSSMTSGQLCPASLSQLLGKEAKREDAPTPHNHK